MTWTIDKNLRVTVLDDEGKVHDAGTAQESTLADVEAWVAFEATSGDLVRSKNGLFFVQPRDFVSA